jgi:hypothetical protein
MDTPVILVYKTMQEIAFQTHNLVLSVHHFVDFLMEPQWVFKSTDYANLLLHVSSTVLPATVKQSALLLQTCLSVDLQITLVTMMSVL